MITAGIDMGAKTIKIVLLKDKKVLAKNIGLSGFEQKEDAKKLFDETLKKCNLLLNDINKIMATGIGKNDTPYKSDEITEVTADTKGAIFLYPNAKTVIDVGAEEGRSIKCDASGKVVDFAINEKCAAGSGSFTESMARALEISLAEFGELSLKSTKSIPMNAQCAVFAESEVVSLIHAKTPKEDIAKAVHDAIASRISSMVLKIGIEKEIIVMGGVAKNIGFIRSLKDTLKNDVIIPDDPEYIGALGAALIASEN